MKKKKYWHPDLGDLTVEEVRAADVDVQKDIMRNWFFDNFEDPAEHTPFEDGDYIYIWGGPYYAEEELTNEFEEVIPENIIEELSKELELNCTEWSGTIDEKYYSAIASNTEFHRTFLQSIDNIKSLIEVEVDGRLEEYLLRLLYVNVISSLETFLSDAFINTVMNNAELIRKLVETTTDFKDQKFTLNELFIKYDSINNAVKNYLLNIVWHNIGRVKPMYKNTLGIDFPTDLEDIFKSIIIRHDIVHRNGKTKEGEEIVLSREDIKLLIDKVRGFVDHIDSQIE